jgi:hypothetical protein
MWHCVFGYFSTFGRIVVPSTSGCTLFTCAILLFRLNCVILRSWMTVFRAVTIMRDIVSRRATVSFRYLIGSIPKKRKSYIHFKLLQFVTFEFLKSVILEFRFFSDVTLCVWVFLDVWKNCCTFNFRVRPSKGLALLGYED